MRERPRLVAALRLLAAGSGLALALVLFARPLGQALGPAAELAEGQARRAWPGAQGGAKGFVVLASSEPPGARLVVDGRPRGRTPMVANVACRDGASVQLRLELPGRRPWSRTVACREGGQLEVRARLE